MQLRLPTSICTTSRPTKCRSWVTRAWHVVATCSIADDAAKQRLVRKLFLILPFRPRRSIAQRSPPFHPPRSAWRCLTAAVRRGLAGASPTRCARRVYGRVGRQRRYFAYGTTEVHLRSSRQPLAGERVRLALSGLSIPTVQDDTAKTGAINGDDVTVIVGRHYGAASQKEASATEVRSRRLVPRVAGRRGDCLPVRRVSHHRASAVAGHPGDRYACDGCPSCGVARPANAPESLLARSASRE